jgi:hypothetical protein
MDSPISFSVSTPSVTAAVACCVTSCVTRVTRSIIERAALFFFAAGRLGAGFFAAAFFTAGRFTAAFLDADFFTAGRFAPFAFDDFFALPRDFDAPRALEVLDADFARDFFFGPAPRFLAFAAIDASPRIR